MAKVGRPSKYTPELLEKAVAYLDDYNHHDAKFPSHQGLALYLGITPSTLYQWAQEPDKQEFSDMLEHIKTVQHEMLVGNGISGDYNAAITKLVLTKHGYQDSQAITGKDNEPLVPKVDSDLEAVRRIAFAFAKVEAIIDDESAD